MLQRRCLRSLHLDTGLPGLSPLATIWAVEPATDGELIARVGEGDSGAFELLYQRYAPTCVRARPQTSRRPRPSRGRGQETFASVWRSAKSYRSDRGPGAPLALRGREERVIVDRRAPSGRFRLSRWTSPRATPADERAEASWTAWRVHRALAELPDQGRKLIELAYWGGTVPERDRRFRRIPLGTVKNADEECRFPGSQMY